MIPSTFEANIDGYRALCDFPEVADYDIVPPVMPFNEAESVALGERCTKFNRLYTMYCKILKIRDEQNELNNPANPIPAENLQRIEAMTLEQVCVSYL